MLVAFCNIEPPPSTSLFTDCISLKIAKNLVLPIARTPYLLEIFLGEWQMTEILLSFFLLSVSV